jgi:hypothetical protein
VIVPADAGHNVRNIGNATLRPYVTSIGPTEGKDGVGQSTKEEADRPHHGEGCDQDIVIPAGSVVEPSDGTRRWTSRAVT